MSDQGLKLYITVAWLVIVTGLSLYLIANLKLVSDIGQFMPASSEDKRLQALMNEIQRGPSTAYLMLRIYNADPEELADLSVQLQKFLLNQPDLFREVLNSDVFIDVDDVDRIFAYRYLLVDDPAWSSDALRENFEQRLEDLQAGAGPLISDLLRTDPQLIFIDYLKGLSDVSGPESIHGVWFDRQNQSAILLARVRSQSLDLDIMQNALNSIQDGFSTIANTSAASIEVAGPGAMAVQTRVSIEQLMQRLSIFMTVLLLVVFLLAYRSLKLLLLAAVPLVSAVIVALVITQIIFGNVHGIVVVFGITLLGVCLDYPLHVFSNLRTGESCRESLGRIWPTLRLSAVTSVMAFLALLGSDFEGLSQLAVFAASGLTIAVIVTRYFLPFWLRPRRIRYFIIQHGFYFGLPAKTMIVFAFVAAAVFSIIKVETFWEYSVDAISPIPQTAKDLDRRLRHAMNLPEVSHVFMLNGPDLEKLLQSTEALEQKLSVLKQQGVVKSTWSPTRILPSAERQGERQQVLPAKEELQQAVDESLSELPFRAIAFDGWVDAVVASKELKPLIYDEVLDTPIEHILRQGLFRFENQWVSVIRLSGIRDESEFRDFIKSEPQLDEYYVNVKQATEHLLNKYLHTTAVRLFAVCIILVGILWWVKKSIKLAALVMLPVGMGVLAGLVLPLLSGQAINIFHLLALLLVLGIGLDYSLFFNRQNCDRLERRQHFHAIVISAVTTTAAFSLLAFSSIPTLASMGRTIAAGVFICFVFAWLLSGRPLEDLPEHE